MKEPSNPAKVNLKNIGRFIQGYSRKFTDAFGLLEDYKKEQVVWRSHQAEECTKNGACIYCGCTTPAKFYSDEACEDPEKKCYPDMMDKETWEKFKEQNHIRVTIYGTDEQV